MTKQYHELQDQIPNEYIPPQTVAPIQMETQGMYYQPQPAPTQQQYPQYAYPQNDQQFDQYNQYNQFQPQPLPVVQPNVDSNDTPQSQSDSQSQLFSDPENEMMGSTLLFVLGFFVCFTWPISFCLFRKSKNLTARFFAKCSLGFCIFVTVVIVAIVVIYIVIFVIIINALSNIDEDPTIVPDTYI